MREFLIYTSAGLNSNVASWADYKNRNYDIWITNYSDVKDNLRENSDYYNESKGAKFPNFKNVVAEHRSFIEHYKAIMVADDDIIISPIKLNNLFSMIEREGVWIVTPAFSRLGKISHETTERKLVSKYRYTNFAEVTCPIFRTDKLLSFLDEYDAEMEGYGVDWWYLNHLGKDVIDKIIISDENYCINPRDFHKIGGTREIDKISTGESRATLWDRKKRQLGIDSFPKKIFERKYRNPLQIIVAAPAYLFERLYASTIDSRYLAKTRKLIKKYLKK